MKLLLHALAALTCVTVCAGSTPNRPSATQVRADIARSLQARVHDGFAFAAVGDIQLVHPISQLDDAGLKATFSWLRRADAAMGNLETSLIDPRHFAGYPQETTDSLRPIGVPEVARDLKAIGFSLLARANNHATDWSSDGMRATDRLLDEAGIVHAGTGDNRAIARAPRFLDTKAGRIGFVSLTTTFESNESALPPLGEVPGRAGASTLRSTRVVEVDHEAMQALRRILVQQPKGSASQDDGRRLLLFGAIYEESNHFAFHYEPNPIDLREFLAAVRQAKLSSDFVAVNVHSHEPGNWSDDPSDMFPPLAHAAIDAGADIVVGEGPHHLRGIEIYKGKPIFYSLGNYAIQFAPQSPVAEDMYEKLDGDPTKITDAELNQSRIGVHVEQERWYESVVAVTHYAKGRASVIELHPIELALGARMADRGIPHAATGDQARRILEDLARLSKSFGTKIQISGDVGLIRVAN